MKPIVNGLEDEWEDQISFRYIDRESPANADIVKEYNILYQPIYVLLDREGNEVKRWAGPVTIEGFEVEFNTVLSR